MTAIAKTANEVMSAQTTDVCYLPQTSTDTQTQAVSIRFYYRKRQVSQFI